MSKDRRTKNAASSIAAPCWSERARSPRATALTPHGARAQAKMSPPNIIKAGTLVMSINPTLPPLQFVNDKGELQGMRVELGNEIAKALGLTPEYVRIEFAAMVPGLAAKRWDMINTGIFWTEERSKLMYMVPYERAAISFLVTKGNPLNINKWEDLAGRAVSVELGGIEERRTREVDEMLKKEGLKGHRHPHLQQFRRILPGAARPPGGRRDLDRRDRDVLAGARRLHPRRRRLVSADRHLRLREQDACADAVVEALNDLRKSGSYDALFDRYGVLKIEEPQFAIRGPVRARHSHPEEISGSPRRALRRGRPLSPGR